MNREDLRRDAASIRSMVVNPNDTGKITLLNQQIDLAVRRLAADHPDAFAPDTQRLILLPDYVSTAVGITVATTADPWVLQFSGSSADFLPRTDGQWDGLYWIEVTGTDGTIHRHQCRTFWDAGAGIFRVSLVHPVESFAGSGLQWRLVQPEFFVRADTIRILNGQLYIQGGTGMVPLPRDYFLDTVGQEYQGTQNGQPTSFYRGRLFQMPAPQRTPAVQLIANLAPAWGPEPIGEFEYCYTYCWGRTSNEFMAPGNYLEPIWESAPSRASASIVVASELNTVNITVPEIAWEVGFNVAGTLRAGHSGIYKRLYRRRKTTGTTPAHGTIEAPDVFQHLAFITDATTVYTDDGSVIPDYYRRLPESQGYYAWTPWPHQNQKYELDLFLQRTPPALFTDTDAPPVLPAHLPMLVELTAHFFAKYDNDAAGAAQHLQAYVDLGKTYRGQQESPSRYTPPRPWGGVPFSTAQPIARNIP